MTIVNSPRASLASKVAVTARIVCATSLVAISVAACKTSEPGTEVAGWSLADPSQRHPILVSQQPSKISLRVARGSKGLTPHQRSQVLAFIDKYRTIDGGNSQLVVSPPSGSANEVASMQAVAEIRYLMRESGFPEAGIQVAPYSEDGDPQPPIRISYTRFVAEAPECQRWTTNIADDVRNVPLPNLGCATQRNFAAQVANPADLLGPRQSTAAPSERRDVYWQKYTAGQSTVSQKTSAEEVKVKGAN